MSRNKELCELFHKLWCKWGNQYAYRQYLLFSVRYRQECLFDS